MAICGISRSTVVAVLAVGFVAVSFGIDQLTKVDCCDGLGGSTLKDLQSEISALREEIDRLRDLHSIASSSMSCEEIQNEMAAKRQKMDELEIKIADLHTEVHRDIFFIWQRALEYPDGTNCSVHMDYLEGDKCMPFKAQHLKEIGETTKKTLTLKTLERSHTEYQLAQNHLKKAYQFKQCSKFAPQARGNLTGCGYSSRRR